MPQLKAIELDVLKPHLPDLVEFAASIAAIGPDYRVSARVVEIDARTETLTVSIEGDALDYKRIQAEIAAMGASVHSIDSCTFGGDDSTDD